MLSVNWLALNKMYPLVFYEYIFLLSMEPAPSKFKSEKIVAFTAILISLCALVVSFYEVRIMRTQQKAMVWPYIIMGQQYSSEGFSILASNKGLALLITILA